MKIFNLILVRGVILALLALGFSSLTARAQTMLQLEEHKADETKIKPSILIVESPTPVDRPEVATVENAAEAFQLHVNDRALRGKPDDNKSDHPAVGVLPQLSDEVPAPPKGKLTKITSL